MTHLYGPEPPLDPPDLCDCERGEVTTYLPGIPRRPCCEECRREYDEQKADKRFEDEHLRGKGA